MSVTKVLSLSDGIQTEVVPATASSGAASSGQLVALNASGQVDSSMLPSSVSTAVAQAGAAQPIAAKGQPNGYASLDANGMLPSSQLPPLAIDQTYVVTSQAAMLALAANVGDIAIRSDINETFILQSLPASTLSHWQQVLTPASPVQSVNGQVGVVNLTASNISGFGTAAVANTTGAGAAVTTGPTTSVSGDIVTFTGTAGQITDSGIAASNLPRLSGSNTFTSAQNINIGTNTNALNLTSTSTSGTLLHFISGGGHGWGLVAVGSAGFSGAPATSFAFNDGTTGTTPFYMTNAAVTATVPVSAPQFFGGVPIALAALNTPVILFSISLPGLLVVRDSTLGGSGVFMLDGNTGVVAIANTITGFSIAISGGNFVASISSGAATRNLLYTFIRTQ